MADADAILDPVTPGSPPSAAPDDASVMTLVDHLGELRTRLFRAILAIAVTTSVAWIWLTTPIQKALINLMPTPDGAKATVQVLGPGDAFAIYLRISVVVGIILAMPVLLYQIWAFIAPGLTTHERKTIRPWIPLALLFFALGVTVAYFILPYALTFLLGFTNDTLVAGFAAGPYFDFVTTMFLVFGLIMEFPILLVGLSRVGIVTSTQLRQSRRMVILGIAVFAAVATPGGDLVSPLALGGTMYILFEGTLLFIRRTGR
jgi:sec-independent protein translocase protein TatC